MKLFFIFGASGDLAKRKIFPALKNLQQEKKLDDFQVFGLSRTLYSNEDFRKYLETWVGDDQCFLQNVFYESFDASKENDFEKLQNIINNLKGKALKKDLKNETLENNPNETLEIFYYLSVAPNLLENILPGLKNLPAGKIIVEKPLGYNLESAKKLNSLLKIFDEKNIFRIDHYLGKPAIQQDFQNFGAKKIKKVEVILAESLGALGRQYYDEAGVVRDMIQNHALNTLTKVLNSNSKQSEKFLNSLKVSNYILGQYEGYRAEDNISDASTTPTYAKVFLTSDLDQFKSSTFVLESGKSMKQKSSLVKICFEDGSQQIINLDENGNDAYKNLIEKVILGEKNYFVSDVQLEKAWEIVDPILEDKNIKFYPVGFEGF